MGGAARSLARRLVADENEPVRDLDLVYIQEFDTAAEQLDDETLDKLSAKYMPDDYSYGHGMQRDSLRNYFATRDLTINQCLIAGNKMLMTRAAYDDLQENILRPSFYEQPKEWYTCNHRILLKILLLQTILKETTKSYPTLEEVSVRNMYGEKVGFHSEPVEDDTEEAETVWSSEYRGGGGWTNTTLALFPRL